MKEIVELVSKHFNVWGQRVYGRGKSYELSKARQISMYFIRKYRNESYPQIGKHFNRGHMTVIHAMKIVENDMATNPVYKQDVEEIEWKIKNLYIHQKSKRKYCKNSVFKIRIYQ